MANIVDYIEWRGDLALASSPFNEVDNLILSEICFLDFQDIVPPPGGAPGIALSDAARIFFEKNPREKINLGLLLPREIPELFEKAAASERFSSALLSDFVNLVDVEREIQFSALTYTLSDNTKYVAFRGTDDTIVAWKEDFNMSILESVPAQTEALLYLRGILAGSPEPVRVGGHSKGGNLAVYAALHLDAAEQERLLAVYNNDGPGFRVSVRSSPAYQRLSDRLHNLTPYLSVVGALLEHGEDFDVLESDGKGVLQHDGFTWHVSGARFIRLPDRSRRSHELEATLKAWLSKLNEEEKRSFINTLFEILSSSGAKTLSELNADKLRAAYAIASSLFTLDKNTRDLLTRTLVLLFREQNAVTRARRAKEKEEKSRKSEKTDELTDLPDAAAGRLLPEEEEALFAQEAREKEEKKADFPKKTDKASIRKASGKMKLNKTAILAALQKAKLKSSLQRIGEKRGGANKKIGGKKGGADKKAGKKNAREKGLRSVHARLLPSPALRRRVRNIARSRACFPNEPSVSSPSRPLPKTASQEPKP